MRTLVALLTGTAAAAFAVANPSFEHRTVVYEHDGLTFESTVVYQPDSETDRPGILMVPNWMGPTPEALEKAAMVAGEDYFVMVVDMYGTDTRPTNASEAGAAAGRVRADRALMRSRATQALDHFKREAAPHGLDVNRIAAIGFCFGGGTVLELGRAGTAIDAVISFHGDLLSPTLENDAGNTTAKVLVLHGADDPYVPQSDVQTFIDVMRNTAVDWQLVQYSGAVHSFTNPLADSDGSRYNETVSDRAFEAMEELLEEIWED